MAPFGASGRKLQKKVEVNPKDFEDEDTEDDCYTSNEKERLAAWKEV